MTICKMTIQLCIERQNFPILLRSIKNLESTKKKTIKCLRLLDLIVVMNNDD